MIQPNSHLHTLTQKYEHDIFLEEKEKIMKDRLLTTENILLGDGKINEWMDSYRQYWDN